MPLLDQLLTKIAKLPRPEGKPPTLIKDIPVRMPDGVELLTDRYVPHGDSNARGPVVLMRTPYGRSGVLARMQGWILAAQGLQTVVQSTRGSFGSGGEFRPFHLEREDGIATAEWIREQPWCDGRLATAGGSYVGHTQWAIGPYLEPPLEAMCLAVTASNFVPNFYPGGTFAADDMVAWSASIGRQEDRFSGWPNPPQFKRTQAAMRSLPLGRADQAAIGRRVQFLHDVTEHSDPTEHYWEGKADHSAGLEELTVPTTMVSGWYDLFLRSQLEDFKRLQAAGRSSRITIGPWNHGQPASIGTLLNDQVSFLKAIFSADPAPLQRPAVRVYLQKADHWLEFENWPPASDNREYFLDASSQLGEHPGATGIKSFSYSPEDPTPNIGGPLLASPAKQLDNAARESRSDVLVFSSKRLKHDLDVIGELEATVFVRSSNPRVDVFVRLCDVDKKGVSLNVCDGIIRLEAIDQAEQAREVKVQLDPTAYRFRAGHQLRVQISAAAWPRYDRNFGTGESVATAKHGEPNQIEVLFGPAHPSRIGLPHWTT